MTNSSSRAWIIGNGKSLLDTPLELLENEVTYGMNRIHLLKKKLHLSYYLMVDYNQQNPKNYWQECIRAHWNTPKYLWEGFRSGHKLYLDLEPIGDVPNTTWIPRCDRHHYYSGANFSKRAESWHFPTLCTAFSGIGTMMQIAVLNGATELYILGADLYVPDYRENFFTPDYVSDQRPRDVIDNQNMIQVHTVAKRSSPIPIYNCTVGGKLEVYERRDMLKVLKGYYDGK